MNYLKNIEVSRKYGVNPTTVTNWINASIEGKNQLQLIEIADRKFILDTPSNHDILSILSDKGRVFKSKDTRKSVIPDQHFFDIFTDQQVSGIILSLETFHEIPSKYTYINGGAEIWKAYAERSVEDNIKNVVTNTISLNKFITQFIMSRAKPGVIFNIIDIGPGDATPMKDILGTLWESNLINKYIGVDISSEMLDIAEANVKSWFGSDFPFQAYVKDITENVIREAGFYNTSSEPGVEVINLLFFLGSTLENQIDFERTMLNLRDSLGNNDYLVLGQSLDTQNAKIYFDFGSRLTPKGQKLYQKSKWIPDLLGIDEIFYHVERYYDDKTSTRKTDIILDVDLSINLNTARIKKIIFFYKGDRITVWRHKHHSFVEINEMLRNLNLFVEFSAVSEDKAQVITISSPTLN